jgi:hypothetical protein
MTIIIIIIIIIVKIIINFISKPEAIDEKSHVP